MLRSAPALLRFSPSLMSSATFLRSPWLSRSRLSYLQHAPMQAMTLASVTGRMVQPVAPTYRSWLAAHELRLLIEVTAQIYILDKMKKR